MVEDALSAQKGAYPREKKMPTGLPLSSHDATNGARDQQATVKTILKKLDILSHPPLTPSACLGRPVPPATSQRNFFLAYICNIRISGFLCGLLLCSLGPYSMCSITQDSYRSGGRGKWDTSSGVDSVPGLRRRFNSSQQTKAREKSRRVSKRPRLEVEQRG